jgi:hypothetical protein
MALIYRALCAAGRTPEGEAGLSEFSDEGEIAPWAREAAAALVGAGIINGADGRINPLGTMTRAEMAAALFRALDL